MIDRINEDWKRRLFNQPQKVIVESQIAAEFSENAKLLKNLIKEFEISAIDSVKEITTAIQGIDPSVKAVSRIFVDVGADNDSMYVEGYVHIDKSARYIVKYIMNFSGSYTVNVMSGMKDIWNGPANPNKIAEAILAHFKS